MDLNKLKKLSLNYLNDIAIYDYKKSNIINNRYLNINNICYDLYYNKNAFKTLNDFILNNNKDYKIITINKAFLNIE